MKFPADENFPRPALQAIREAGFDVAAITEDQPGALDEHVLARCRIRMTPLPPMGTATP